MLSTKFRLVQIQRFAENKILENQKLKFMSRRVENIVGKRENAGNRHFCLFPQSFQKLSFPEVLKDLPHNPDF